jgi:hypothetical protein
MYYWRVKFVDENRLIKYAAFDTLDSAYKQGVPITDIVRTALEHHASWVALNKNSK